MNIALNKTPYFATRVVRARRWFAFAMLLLLGLLCAPSAHAQTAAVCNAATTQGTAPSDYQNYCWLDFSAYSDTTARSAAGQTFTFTLPDGSKLKLTLNITTTIASGTTAINAVSTPSWSGAAFGNSAFIGIAGKSVLYEAVSGSTVKATLSGITMTAPGTSGTSGTYAIIAADGESTNTGETLSFTTNGSAWTQLAQVSNGSYYPTVTGTGTTTVMETGTQSISAGSFVFGSFNSPTTVSGTMVGNGLQGVTFAVRFASVSVNTVFNTTRVNAADQITYAIASGTGSSATTIVSKTSTGTTAGPFTPAIAPTLAASYPLTVSEVMASGSSSTLANYSESLTCTNGSTVTPKTAVPTNVSTTSYTFASLQYGDAIACTFTNTPFPSITGTVYNDVNHNTHIDPTETGTGLTSLYVKFTTSVNGVCQSPATLAVAVNATTGAYTLPGVAAGNYCIIVNGDSSLTDITPAYPTGWIGTEASTGVRQLTINTATPPAQNFGLYNGSNLSGTVFDDTGIGSGTANNGVKDGTEAGVASVTVNAVSGGTTVSTAVTAANGTYTLWIPASVTASVVATPVLPSGYLATGGSAGTTGGSYTRPSVTFTPSSGLLGTGVNFGIVPANTFAPDNTQTAAPGAEIFYPHTFVAASGGSVTFSTSATATPTNPDWLQTLYLDVNCTGQFASGDTLIAAAITVTAGQKVCVLMKEFVPKNAPANAQNAVVVSAAFNYTNASPTLSATITHTDTTTVTTSGGVLLTKSVSNLTQSGSSGTSNNASPGDSLKYQLVVTNPGVSAVSTLVVNDTTPTFTNFISASCPTTLPTGLTACSVTTQPAVGAQGALTWTFTGSFAAGASVTVSFQVTVSQ